MSKLAVIAVVWIMVVVSYFIGRHNSQAELEVEYERGRQDAYGEIKRDSLANISDSIYFDSTDTMPAVESDTERLEE